MADKEVKTFDTMEKAIKSKKRLLDSDYVKLNFIALGNLQKKTMLILREQNLVIVVLFLLSWFKVEVISIITNIATWTYDYVKFAVEGFNQISLDTKYTFLVVTPISLVIGYMLGNKRK